MKHMVVTTVVLWAFLLQSAALSAEESPEDTSKENASEVDTKLPIGPILVGSFGLVTVAVGAGFAWQAYEENDDYNTEMDGQYPFATNKLADDIKTHAIVADVLMFGGGAVVIASLLWWLIDDDYDTETKGEIEVSTAKWRPVIGPGQAGLIVEF
jgi:ABC-type transport system involved in cytochrome c biogenesis permease subunit